MNPSTNKALELILSANNAVALTGAGVSTDSGIPDFRSPQSGLWQRISPMEVFSTWGFQNNPKKFYEIGLTLLPHLLHAKPNVAHQLITELENRGFIKAIITQNIDSLHQKAGAKNVLEIHGNLREGTCQSCFKNYTISQILHKLNSAEIPPCCQCGDVIKPNLVLFGDMLPPDFQKALQYCQECDLLIVMGSSLVIFPASELPQLALDNRAKLLIINRDKTPYDKQATLTIHGELQPICNQILHQLKLA